MRSTLTAERITELSLKLAILSSQRTIGQVDLQYQQLEQALRWHRSSCQPIQVALRLVQSLFSRRLTNCGALITQQKMMLRMAANEASDEARVLDALVGLSTVVAQFELGPDTTPKQRLAFAACEIPAVRARFALLVREGEIDSSPDGLKLLNASRRRIVAYAIFAMLAIWPGMIFIMMAMHGTLDLRELAGYLVGTVGLSAYLTRGLFTRLRADERSLQDLNSQLKPRPTACRGRPSDLNDRGGVAQR